MYLKKHNKMKRLLTVVVLLIVVLHTNAQGTLIADQNPNYQNSLDKYKDSPYLALQGTTKQQTYKAIDPIEEKRELKALRRQYRANRPLWRHQRALQRIENTQYYAGSFNSYRDFGYQPRYQPNRYHRNFGSRRWLNSGTAFGLGLGYLGYRIFR
jgi:hypothetical protein